jgi:hypothetical protein
MTVKNTDTATKAGLLISYYIVLSFWAAQTLAMSMLSRNVGGQTKKSIVVTLNFVSWCTGNAIGLWPSIISIRTSSADELRRSTGVPVMERATIFDSLLNSRECLPQLVP